MAAQRRAKGEGTIDKLESGRWRARVTLADGRRLSKTDARKEVVSAWLKKLSEQSTQGLTYSGAKTTTGDYLSAWLASVKNSVRPQTFVNYKNLVENHLIPAFGPVLIKDLTADKIQAVFDDWSLSSGAPVRTKIYELFKRILNRAKTTGLIVRNPCEMVIRPKYKQSEMKFWSEEEANAFLTAASSSRLYALMHTALITGAREGELLGLKWEDIDFKSCIIRFRRQLTQDYHFSPIKTDAGNRALMIGDKNMAILRRHYENQQQERVYMGEKWRETGLVFTSPKGAPVNRCNILYKEFYRLIEAAGVPRIRFHDLRHTCVAILFNQNTPVYKVSWWLGHSKTSITTDIYGHLIPKALDGLADMLYTSISPVNVTESYGHDKVMDDAGQIYEGKKTPIYTEKQAK